MPNQLKIALIVAIQLFEAMMKNKETIITGTFAGMLSALVMSAFIINASLDRKKECYVEVSRGKVAVVKMGIVP